VVVEEPPMKSEHAVSSLPVVVDLRRGAGYLIPQRQLNISHRFIEVVTFPQPFGHQLPHSPLPQPLSQFFRRWFRVHVMALRNVYHGIGQRPIKLVSFCVPTADAVPAA
jgi:hypothetical protein